MLARLQRAAHRLHRTLGSLLWLLLASWFASGAVMTFGGFPHFTERERLLSAPALSASRPQLPPALQGYAASGEVLLSELEGEARWLFDERGVRRALAAQPPWQVSPLTEARARRELERRSGARVAQLHYLREPDQWSVPLPAGLFPLWHARLADREGRELYLCAATGEVVQESVRSERVLAWLGAIPHWIYPTVLRRQRVLWRNTILWLAGAGLLLTTFGLLAGLDVRRRLRRRRARKAGAAVRKLRDPVLRWHQRLGLGFGLLVCSWLFSGALSFTPFAWTGSAQPWQQAEQRLLASEAARQRPSSRVSSSQQPVRVAETLALCRQQLVVRELALVALAGGRYLVCRNAERSLIVRQQQPLIARARLADPELAAIATRLAVPHGVGVRSLRGRPDDFYYASHFNPELALPYLYVEANDAERSSWYLDPRNARLLAVHTRRTRLERWLYHGLHSWDLPVLTRRPWLWRGLLLLAMSSGLCLSSLGGFMALRRLWRKRQSSVRLRDKT